jgi:hypothetical protein
VLDLADRIRKRKRAAELSEEAARQLKDNQVTLTIVHGDRAVELSGLTPDQLLDLLGDDISSETGSGSGDGPGTAPVRSD